MRFGHALVCVVALVALCGGVRAQGAGTAGSPPPDGCGVAGSLTVFAPGKAALTGGGSVDIETLLYFEQTNPIGAPCAPVPFTAFVEVLLSGPGGNLLGLAIAPVNPGFNVVPVTLTSPAGPTRINSGTAVARVQTGGSGQVWIESLPFQIEVVAPEPAAPSLPEGVSLEFIAEGVSLAHPGDERSLTLRITNASPTEPFSGALDVRAPNAAQFPVFTSGNFGAGWSIGDPDPEVGGFNVAVPPDGQDGFGCAILEQLAAPAASGSVFVALPPGASQDIQIDVRSRTLSANGSAGQGVAVLQGTLGVAMEEASAFFAHGADAFLPPDYACKGSGATSFIEAVAPDTLNATGAPDGVDIFDARIRALTPQILDMGGAPHPATINFSSPPVGPFRGRLQLELTPPPGLDFGPADEPFELVVPIELTALDLMGVRPVSLRSAQPVAGLPTGLETIAPYLSFRAEIAGGDAPIALLEGVHQWSGEATLDSGDTVPLQFLEAHVEPLPARDGYTLHAIAVAPSGTRGVGLPPLIEFARIKHDFRTTSLPGCGCDFNGDFVIDFSDLNALLSAFGDIGPAPVGDCNASGTTDFTDLNMLLTDFGGVCP